HPVQRRPRLHRVAAGRRRGSQRAVDERRAWRRWRRRRPSARPGALQPARRFLSRQPHAAAAVRRRRAERHATAWLDPCAGARAWPWEQHAAAPGRRPARRRRTTPRRHATWRRPPRRRWPTRRRRRVPWRWTARRRWTAWPAASRSRARRHADGALATQRLHATGQQRAARQCRRRAWPTGRATDATVGRRAGHGLAAWTRPRWRLRRPGLVRRAYIGQLARWWRPRRRAVAATGRRPVVRL